MTDEIIVRMPRLLKKELSGTVLKEAGRFHPLGLSLELNMYPLSTATMILAEDDLDVKIHDFVELYTQHGSVGIFRVASIEKTYRNRRRVELNHALDVLNDAIYATLDDDEEEFNGSPKAFITKLLGAQKQKIGNTPFWQIGTCSDTESWQKKLRFQNVLEALCDLGKAHEDYYFTFDFTTFPWTLNFVARSNTVVSEFRLNRNISSCAVTVDDTDLCTLLYLSIDTKEKVMSSEEEDAEVLGEKTEQTFSTYNDSAAQAHWGVVEKSAGVEFPSEALRMAKLQTWVDDYFARHHAPLVQISINGQDLKEITGVSIDEIQMGKICRVALPEYSDVFLERVVTVRYPDALRKPTTVNVSLANKRQTTEDSIAAVKKEAARAGGAGGAAGKKAENNETELARQKYLYNLKVEQDNMHFAILATEEQWSEAKEAYLLTHETKFYQDARKFNLIASESDFEDAEDGGVTLVSSLRSFIELTASHLRTEFDDGLNSLRAYIELTASHLRTEFSDDINSLRSYVELTASHLRTEFEDEANSLRSYVEITAEHFYAAYEDLNNSLRSYVELTASHLRTEFSDETNSLRSYVELTASHLRTEFTDDVNSLRSYVELTASHLQVEFADDVNSLRSYVELTASNLRTEFYDDVDSLRAYLEFTASQLRVEFTDDANSLRSAIEQNAAAIALKVSQGDVATQLAVEVGNVTITGGNLVVDGMITSASLAAEIANLNMLSVPGILYVTGAASFSEDVTFGDAVVGPGAQFETLYFGPSGAYDAADGVYSIGPATESNGQITIPWTRFNGTAGTPVNFNIAATQTYIDGVAAAEAGVTVSLIRTNRGYDSANNRYFISVRADASNGDYEANTFYVSAPTLDSQTAGTATYSAAYNEYTIPVTALFSNGYSDSDSITIDASDAYNAGESSVTVTGASGWSSGANTLTLSNGVTYTTYMPAQNSATWSSYKQGTNYLVYCTVGGREYSHTFSL